VDRKAFVGEEEKALFRELQKAEAAVRASRPATPDSFLGAFVPMIPAVNAFFDKVLVMANKKALRENRLGLLQRISALSSGVVDLSRLEGF
jgi:glycyl-tRNA synthetase beta subunit